MPSYLQIIGQSTREKRVEERERKKERERSKYIYKKKVETLKKGNFDYLAKYGFVQCEEKSI